MKKGAYVLGLALLLSASQAHAQSWTAPTSTPPTGNIASPINVGTVAQVKNGGLSVNAFTAYLNSYFAGNVGIGAAPSVALEVYNGVTKLWHGSTAGYTSFQNGNEINYYNNGNTAATLYLQYRGGDTNIGANAVTVKGSGGNVGIATTSPLTALAVGGTITTTGGVKFADGTTLTSATGASQWTTSGSNIYNSNAGNVGVGNTGPSYKLDVTGTGRFTGNLTASAGITLSAQNQALALGQQGRITGSYGAFQNVDSGSDKYAMLWNAVYDWSSAAYAFQNTNGQGAAALVLGNDRQLNLRYKAGPATAGTTFTWDSTPFTINSSGNMSVAGTGTFGSNAVINGGGVSYFNGGNVGIGNSSPQARLHVGNTSYTGFNTSYQFNDFGPLNVMVRDNAQDSYIVNNAMFTSGSTWQRLLTGGATRIGSNSVSAGALDFKVAPTGTAGSTFTWVDAMTILPSGNIGIGTVSPGSILEADNSLGGSPGVSGTSQTTGIFRARNGNNVLDIGGFGGSGFWLQSTNATNLATNYNLAINPNGGNVGIGTTSPLTALEVNGQITTTGGIKFADGTTQTSAASGSFAPTGPGRIPFANASNALTDSSTFVYKIGTGSAGIGRLELGTTSRSVAVGEGVLNLAQTGTPYTGYQNTGLGWQSLGLLTTGNANVGVGASALQAVTTGSQNVGIGRNALWATNSGVNNIGIGDAAGGGVTTGWNNIGIGAGTLTTLVSAPGYNVAMGYNALYTTNSSYNVAIGSNAMEQGGNGSDAVAVGYNAMHSWGGPGNTAVGSNALYGATNTVYGYNTAVGYKAIYTANTNAYNTAVGALALTNSSGGGNVAVGYQAGAADTAGNYNTYIGYNAGQTGGAVLTNAAAIGNGASVTASNAMSLGNSSVSVGVGGITAPGYKLEVNGSVGAASFFYTSDRSLKKNIQPLNDSLAKIQKLQGVSFNWKKDDSASIGLIAQDVEKVYPELVNTNKVTGLKSVEYANLVAPLIEAVKEQQKTIEGQEQRIQALEKKLELLTR